MNIGVGKKRTEQFGDCINMEFGFVNHIPEETAFAGAVVSVGLCLSVWGL